MLVTADPHCQASLKLIETVKRYRSANVSDAAKSELAKIRAFATLGPSGMGEPPAEGPLSLLQRLQREGAAFRSEGVDPAGGSASLHGVDGLPFAAEVAQAFEAGEDRVKRAALEVGLAHQVVAVDWPGVQINQHAEKGKGLQGHAELGHA